MFGTAMLLGMALLAMDEPAVLSRQTAADQITLRDGSVVLGLVSSITPGPRGTVEFLVRRSWAEKSQQDHLQSWDRSIAAPTRLAVRERRQRLEAWRRQRAGSAG